MFSDLSTFFVFSLGSVTLYTVVYNIRLLLILISNRKRIICVRIVFVLLVKFSIYSFAMTETFQTPRKQPVRSSFFFHSISRIGKSCAILITKRSNTGRSGNIEF